MAYISRDLLANSWIDVNPKNMDLEINSVIYRQEVEESSFYLSLIDVSDEILMKKMTDSSYYESNPFNMKEYKKQLKLREEIIKNKEARLKEYKTGF